MVKGLQNVRKLTTRIPELVKEEVTKTLEREASTLVNEINQLKPLPEIIVDWTWGDAPAGSVTVGRVANNEFDKISITIFAVAPQGSGFSAAWFEFGTKDRFHQSGKYVGRITASPYFFPPYRANRRRARGNISRAVTRGFKRAAK